MPGGRPRKPDEVKILEGTFRQDRDGDPSASVVADGIPEPPAHLKGDALKFWSEVVPGLIAAGLAKERDATQLTFMCTWYVRARRYEKAADKMPCTHKRLASMTMLANMAWKAFDRLASRFGLTPSDRAKLRIEQAPKKQGVMSRRRNA
jgi:P27 family predicted phage terminase small subunit